MDRASVPHVLLVTSLVDSQRKRLSHLEYGNKIVIQERYDMESLRRELDRGLLRSMPFRAVISRPVGRIAFQKEHLARVYRVILTFVYLPNRKVHGEKRLRPHIAAAPLGKCMT